MNCQMSLISKRCEYLCDICILTMYTINCPVYPWYAENEIRYVDRNFHLLIPRTQRTAVSRKFWNYPIASDPLLLVYFTHWLYVSQTHGRIHWHSTMHAEGSQLSHVCISSVSMALKHATSKTPDRMHCKRSCQNIEQSKGRMCRKKPLFKGDVNLRKSSGRRRAG